MKADSIFERIKETLRPVDDIEHVQGIVARILQEELPHRLASSLLYETLIDSLLRNKLPEAAMATYGHMKSNGFLPSDQTDAKLVGIVLLSGLEEPQSYLERLTRVFSNDDYGESDVVDLLHLMSIFDMDKKQIRALAELFVEAKGEGYEPSGDVVTFIIQGGATDWDLEQALDSLERRRPLREKRRLRHESKRNPFASLLEGIRRTDIHNHELVDRVLTIMEENAIQPNTDVLNQLLARYVSLGHTSSAISTYKVMRTLEQANSTVSPNAFTFGSMFLLHRHIRPTVMRRHQSEQHLSLPTRTLFRDMWNASCTGSRPLILKTPLLNAAIRAFLYQQDYPAAYVALTTFFRKDTPLNHRTYYAVVKHIARRIWGELYANKRKLAKKWTQLFLGVSYEEIELNEDLVNNMLYLVSRTGFNIDTPLYQPSIQKRKDPFAFKMPTMEMMQSVPVPYPLDFKYEVEPLKRLLRRAIRADAPWDSHWSDQQLDDVVQDAAMEMIGESLPRRRS